MFKLISLVVLLNIINNCYSEVLFKDEKATHPDFPEFCYYKNDGHVFGVGQFYRPYGKDGGCYAYECQEPGVIGIHKCDTIQLAEYGCKRLRKDKSSPHPHCCDRYLCSIDGEEAVINASVRSDLERLGIQI